MQVRKLGQKALVLVSALAASAVALADTGADAAFTAATTATTTSVTSYGGSLVAVSAVGVGFMIAIKYIKKIRGAA